jgi:hypothetical protein
MFALRCVARVVIPVAISVALAICVAITFPDAAGAQSPLPSVEGTWTTGPVTACPAKSYVWSQLIATSGERAH